MKKAFAGYIAAQATELRTEHLTIVRPDGQEVLTTAHRPRSTSIDLTWPGAAGASISMSVSHGESANRKEEPVAAASVSLSAGGDILGDLSAIGDATDHDEAGAWLRLEQVRNGVLGDYLQVEPSGVALGLAGGRSAVADFRMVPS